ncbi:major facilitator superfamily domain-containing protein [Phlyctochytrium arcticum]|nr:major facilitator superfamily domain-containing protein [Phlyctochytrium arcticum]
MVFFASCVCRVRGVNTFLGRQFFLGGLRRNPTDLCGFVRGTFWREFQAGGDQREKKKVFKLRRPSGFPFRSPDPHPTSFPPTPKHSTHTMSTTETTTGPRLSMLQLAALTLPWVGVQAIWSTEFGVITPVMESYGLGAFWSQNIWIFGPITGFFTAPIVGAYSDACTSKYGRRKPFIAVGLILTVIASIVFAMSYKYGGASLPVAFIAFIVLDITINVIQTPLRALAGDNAAEDQQTTVQLLATLCQGVGSIIGFGLMKGFWSGKPSELPKLLITVMAINVVFISLTFFLVKERVNTRVVAVRLADPFVTVARNVFRMDYRMAIVCAIEFLSWAAAFAYWPTASSWWGRSVYKGCSEETCTVQQKADYEEGQRRYGDSSLYQAIIQTFFGLFLAFIVSKGYLTKIKIPYAIGLGLGAVMFILAKFGPQTVGMAYAVTLLWAITNSAINAFPFALVGKYAAQDNADEVGVRMGLLNLFICLPQLIITFIVSALRSNLGVDGLPWTFLIAGCCLGLAAILCFFIKEDPVPVSNTSTMVDGSVPAYAEKQSEKI